MITELAQSEDLYGPHTEHMWTYCNNYNRDLP